jgi:hypothetical protein
VPRIDLGDDEHAAVAKALRKLIAAAPTTGRSLRERWRGWLFQRRRDPVSG